MADPVDSLSRLIIPAAVLPQRAFSDPIIHQRTIGGPDDPSDRRLVLRRQDLETMLSVARATPAGSLVIHHVGLVVRVHRSHGGHQYESVHIVGSRLEPMQIPL